jgi:hypothetical protein
MSPFGARGLNSGVADAENLAWKLAFVGAGLAPAALLDTFAAERRAAALANLAVTDATMRFMVPHGAARRLWRTLILRGSPHAGWLRRRVNSGQLAEPYRYAASEIVEPGPDDERLPRHGAAAPDARLAGGGRLRDHLGRGFVVLAAGVDRAPPLSFDVPCEIVADAGSALGAIYDAPDAGRAWVIRPDGHIAASRPIESASELPAMVDRAAGRLAT